MIRGKVGFTGDDARIVELLLVLTELVTAQRMIIVPAVVFGIMIGLLLEWISNSL
jgi:hypothetical protein